MIQDQQHPTLNCFVYGVCKWSGKMTLNCFGYCRQIMLGCLQCEEKHKIIEQNSNQQREYGVRISVVLITEKSNKYYSIIQGKTNIH